MAVAKCCTMKWNLIVSRGSVSAAGWNAARQMSTDGSTTKKPPQHTSKYIKSVPDKEIRKTVFISQSNDVFTNLALEDWIYRNYDFTHHHVLMLWSNNPCVVIGRHQNPFVEANISALAANGIELARRNSGGGAVYHDRGNLNCSFFMPRERYDRKYNLTLLTRALFREFAINADLSERDDLTILGKKVRALPNFSNIRK